MISQYDIAIVGAGLVGSSLACALAKSPYRIVLIDSQVFPTVNADVRPNDGRSIALALASKKMFSALGLWDVLARNAVAIKKIHISNQGRFGVTRLDSAQHGVESFGYLVPAHELSDSLVKHIEQHSIKRLQPFQVTEIRRYADGVTLQGKNESIAAKLLIAADGANSFIRDRLNIEVEEKSYQQTAIVGSIETERPHQNTAYERFTEHGPLAFLPRLGNQSGFIWMNPTDTAKRNYNLSDTAFMDELQENFGFRLGHFSNISKRFAYPLSLLVSQQRVHERVVLIGNAAQTLHPIAGQGLNLALRDIAELCEILVACEDGFDAIDAKLHDYQAKRQPDIENTIRFTDRLNFLFTADYPLLSHSRGLGLALLGAIPSLEERIVKQNLGALGSTASLLQGRALSY